MLCQAAHAEDPATECLIVLDEVDALSRELETLREGQVVVVFYDKLEPVMKLLKSVGALPVSTIRESKPVSAVQTYHIYSAIGT
jgi:cyanophycin synthetase